MKNKKNIIIIVGIIVIGLIAIFLVYNILNASKTKKENIDEIKNSYNNLTEEVKKYNEIRTKYNEKLSNFILDRYKDEHKEYISLLNEYNETIKNIDIYINNLSNKCNILYDNVNINKICSNYQEMYEKLINIYITDIKTYNNNIKKYNEYKNDTIEEFIPIYNDYIDYNKDNIYEGSDDNETN